ncbi:MAG: IS701 family transposase [Betaproteobacteria bacterium]|nr:IS701 family transposase [Betaproteobacteria bacterium]
MGSSVESRFERYSDVMVKALGHADRATPARWYLRGLMLPGKRKSVEPMAARVHPQDVRSAHQSMHHLVADSEWSDTALLAAVAREVVPVLSESGQAPCFWIIDDTGFRKYGKHSVGVARQYCGQLGKTENCQVAVSLSLATTEGSVPLDYRLYLPQEWTKDKSRCKRAGVPKEIAFATKGELAWRQVEAALAAGIPRGTVLIDAGYGDEAALRDRLSAHGLPYAVGIKPATAVWWDEHQLAPALVQQARGRRRTRVLRDETHQPIGVRELAKALPAASYRTMTWREGTNAALRSRFARVRVRAAHADRPREEEWLLIEWPKGEAEPTRYFLSTLSAGISFEELVATVKMRWRIERDYLELKQEVGLGHYEGRNWRGFHHHASLCIAAYGFLMLERLSGSKKNAARLKAPALPEGFRPRGAGSDATANPVVDRHRALSPGPGHRPTSSAMPVLRETVRASR